MTPRKRFLRLGGHKMLLGFEDDPAPRFQAGLTFLPWLEGHRHTVAPYTGGWALASGVGGGSSYALQAFGPWVDTYEDARQLLDTYNGYVRSGEWPWEYEG